MTIRDRFNEYDAVDTGICVIAFERNSPITFCNRRFAGLLSTHPDHLEGRSIDEIIKSDRLHYDSMKPIAAKNSFAVGLLGGFCIEVFDQLPHTRLVRTLKVTRVDTHKFDGKTYFVGYVRKPTRLELLLKRVKLDASLDPYWKPVVMFLSSGKLRPWLTASSAIWLPWIINHSPEIGQMVGHFLQETYQ